MNSRWKARTVVTLALALCACGGGGGGGGGYVPQTTTYKMTDVKPPANAGTEGGFVYATQQTVAVDIALPYPNVIVTVYDQRPRTSIYDASGNRLASPKVTTPVQLARGVTSGTVNPADSMYHYTTTVTVPAAAAAIYVEPVMGLLYVNANGTLAGSTAVVPISGGKAVAVFKAKS